MGIEDGELGMGHWAWGMGHGAILLDVKGLMTHNLRISLCWKQRKIKKF
ncbi:hypothetical protein COO91_06380 [Nostoc flagelliforme CCNUN1]|uniref:Uncharacterized protein n=1 Tax=Nostoc flagelliforme CCNUN1 TaxID=2038116 RepID=A0A2K8SY43_9NOSO|nr:hypothetical protein COO91_06380 [Nostoc flagelliforme CCNUN1]